MMARTTTTTTAHHHHHHHHESARDRSCPPRDRSSPSMEPASSRSIDRRGRGPLMRDPPGRDWSRWVPHSKREIFLRGNVLRVWRERVRVGGCVDRRSSVVGRRANAWDGKDMYASRRARRASMRASRASRCSHACMHGCMRGCVRLGARVGIG